MTGCSVKTFKQSLDDYLFGIPFKSQGIILILFAYQMIPFYMDIPYTENVKKSNLLDCYVLVWLSCISQEMWSPEVQLSMTVVVIHDHQASLMQIPNKCNKYSLM